MPSATPERIDTCAALDPGTRLGASVSSRRSDEFYQERHAHRLVENNSAHAQNMRVLELMQCTKFTAKHHLNPLALALDTEAHLLGSDTHAAVVNLEHSAEGPSTELALPLQRRRRDYPGWREGRPAAAAAATTTIVWLLPLSLQPPPRQLV